MAEDPVAKATRLYKRAQDALSGRRVELIYEIGRALEAGRKQAEIVEITGFTREHVRRLHLEYVELNSEPDPFAPDSAH